MNDDYGCLMLYINIPNWKDLLRFIDESEIIDDGFEDNPHITILYGIDISNQTYKHRIKHMLNILSLKKFPINITGISVFENNDSDVLKFDVESSLCESLNMLISEIFPNVKLHEKYNPHMTIAYMQPGTGKKYSLELDSPITIYPSRFVYTEGYPSNNGTISYNLK
jgi:hypothetical protein